jgi:hypothetical protein
VKFLVYKVGDQLKLYNNYCEIESQVMSISALLLNARVLFDFVAQFYSFGMYGVKLAFFFVVSSIISSF